MHRIQPKAANFEFDDGRAPQTSKSKKSVWERLNPFPKHSRQAGEDDQKRQGRAFPYKDSLKGRIFGWLVSRRFQIALQVVIGLAFTNLFTFVRQLRFLEACLGSILALAGFVLLSPHPHVGCLLMTASILLFCATYLPVYTGALASLAFATGKGHYTGSLIAFALIGFIPIALMRASPGNPGPGIMCAILYGVLLIFTLPRLPEIKLMWRLELANIMASICLSGAGVIVSAILALPTLAGHQLQDNLAKSLRGTGQRLSGFSSFIVGAEEHEQKKNSISEKGLEEDQELNGKQIEKHESLLHFPESHSSEADFLRAINKRTDPKAEQCQHTLTGLFLHTEFKLMRAYLDECKLLMLESTLEPAFLQKGRFMVSEWGKVLMDTRSLLTRVGALGILVESEQLMHASMLQKELGVNPLPSIGIVLAELSATCQSLSEAIRLAGNEKAEKLLTAISWSEMRHDLKVIVATSQQGYNEKHTSVDLESEIDTRLPREIQTKALLLLVCLINGIISSIEDLESSIPAALGHALSSTARRDLGTTSVQRLSHLHIGNPNPDKFNLSPDSKMEVKRPGNGQGGDKLSSDEVSRSDRATSSSNGEVKLDIDDKEESDLVVKKGLTVKQHLAFLKPFIESIFGVTMYKRLKPIVWVEFPKALKSWQNFKSTLQNRRVQYGFKFWLTPMVVLVTILGVGNTHRQTKEWRLYYGYITSVIISIEKVEAVVWKTVQRICGTLVGGTLAYLIMLRENVNSRGVVVDILVLTSLFVVANRLESRFRYSVWLTMLTLSSLTLCQFGNLKEPGADLHTWIERVSNIIVACLFATAMSWIILPWYASDNQLCQIGEALQNSAELLSDIFDAFTTSCEEAAKGVRETKGDIEAHKRLNQLLESSVVQPVEAAALGLRVDGVLWKRGFLSTPRIVHRLVEEMSDLVHRLTSLELAVTSAPEEFGGFSAAIYHQFVAPLGGDTKAILEEVHKLTEACFPILKNGPSAEHRKKVEEPLCKMGIYRGKFRLHLQELKETRRKEAESSQKISMTPADVIRIGSFAMAMSHVMDKVMLIARIVIDDSYEARETRISNLVAMDGTRRDLGKEFTEGDDR